jgi:hypothetical protein
VAKNTVKGNVRMYKTNDAGKKYTQGLFCIGTGFGEPPLFIDETYQALNKTNNCPKLEIINHKISN